MGMITVIEWDRTPPDLDGEYGEFWTAPIGETGLSIELVHGTAPGCYVAEISAEDGRTIYESQLLDCSTLIDAQRRAVVVAARWFDEMSRSLAIAFPGPFQIVEGKGRITVEYVEPRKRGEST